jgi:hypothetical protein
VLAVDLFGLPQRSVCCQSVLVYELSLMSGTRPLPPNLTFRILDIAKPFPFEPQTFDIVHARLVFLHVRVDGAFGYGYLYPKAGWI